MTANNRRGSLTRKFLDGFQTRTQNRDRLILRTDGKETSTFSPDANGVGANAGELLIALTPLALRLNVSLQVCVGYGC